MRTLILLAFLWFNGSNPISYTVSRNADPVVGVAVEMMKTDLSEVTGLQPVPASSSTATLRIVQFDKEKTSLARLGVPSDIADSLRFVKEAFYVGRNGRQMIVVGSDARGTAYGVLEISRLAGVSPWTWWGDSHPEKRTSLDIPDDYRSFQHPSVEYRGIFLNDEDWAFRAWSTQTFSPQENPETISVDTYREVFKLLLRLRANTIWPAMHPGTTSFYNIPGARQCADSMAISIGTSHCEPLLRSNTGEWDVAKRGNYNYMNNRQAVQDYWKERLLEVGKDSDDLFTIGMRGIHDGSMEGLERASLDEKTAALQTVIDDQREMLRKYVNKDITKIPQMFMPYKEVLEIMENGLEVPDDVTIVWCDDNYGYMTRLPDAQQQKRSGGSGVYYHLSYCGRPLDYLWLSTSQPGLIYHEMKEAYDHNVRKLWIANVNDPKKAAYDMEFFLDMAWNIDFVQPESINSHLAAWLEREFGKAAGNWLAAPMAEYYRLCSIRKPEFMGWAQCELPDKQRYPLGLSPVVDTEFSFTEFGNEAQRHIDSWRRVRRSVEEAASLVPERSKDFFFAIIEYPVNAAGLMVEKLLYAQRSRQLAKTTYSPGVWKVDKDMYAAAALSQKAYQGIRSLTQRYNFDLAGGKWQNAISDHPRDLYVFWAPNLPVNLTEAEQEEFSALGNDWRASRIRSFGADFISMDAADYKSASKEVSPVQNMGHSGKAVPVEKGEYLSYEFTAPKEGKAVIRVAVSPTQANDKGDIRFSVSIDGKESQVFSIKEPYRSDQWKENVMRNQRVINVPVDIKAGKHTLKLSAVDNHIIFDQWMLDYKVSRRFYVFPR